MLSFRRARRIPSLGTRMHHLDGHLLICLLSGLLTLAAPAQEPSWRLLDRLVDAAYEADPEPQRLRLPSYHEQLDWEHFINACLDAALFDDHKRLDSLDEAALGHGYHLREVAIDDERLWVLNQRQNRGGGLFLIRPGPAEQMLILAPHSQSARLSERCAVRCFWASHARLAAFSTLPPQLQDRHASGDLAEQDLSLMAATTRAMARTIDNLCVIQVMGLDDQDAGLPRRSLVISNGSRNAGTELQTLTPHLAHHWGPVTVLHYPRDFPISGGLLSAHGRIIQRFPAHRFLHLALSDGLRNDLATAAPIERFDLRAALP